MKKHTIEQKIFAARPDDAKSSEEFVLQTMKRVGDAKVGETFSKLLRTSDATNKKGFSMKIHNAYTQFKSLPRLTAVAIIIGTPVTVGAATYATYQWINPKVTITNVQPHNDENKRQYTIDSECGDFHSGKDINYELAQDSKLTDQDVQKIFENTCSYHAVTSFIESKWIGNNGADDVKAMKEGDIITLYNYVNMFGGSSDANPVFGITIGNVTAIDTKNVTFEIRQYTVDNSLSPAAVSQGSTKYFPEGTLISRTLSIAQDAEVWIDGSMINLSDVKIGDQIQVVTREQHKAKYYEDIQQIALGEQIRFDVVGIIKTNLDTKYIADESSRLGAPQIINDLALVEPCDNNTEYACVQPPSQVVGAIYEAFEPSSSDLATPNKYLRKDFESITQYSLSGRITKIDGVLITLQTRGKKVPFVINLPYDAIGKYNQPRERNTELDRSTSLPVEVGDLVNIRYAQKTDEDRLTIKSSDLHSLFLVQRTNPDGSFTKY